MNFPQRPLFTSRLSGPAMDASSTSSNTIGNVPRFQQRRPMDTYSTLSDVSESRYPRASQNAPLSQSTVSCVSNEIRDALEGFERNILLQFDTTLQNRLEEFTKRLQEKIGRQGSEIMEKIEEMGEDVTHEDLKELIISEIHSMKKDNNKQIMALKREVKRIADKPVEKSQKHRGPGRRKKAVVTPTVYQPTIAESLVIAEETRRSNNPAPSQDFAAWERAPEVAQEPVADHFIAPYADMPSEQITNLERDREVSRRSIRESIVAQNSLVARESLVAPKPRRRRQRRAEAAAKAEEDRVQQSPITQFANPEPQREPPSTSTQLAPVAPKPRGRRGRPRAAEQAANQAEEEPVPQPDPTPPQVEESSQESNSDDLLFGGVGDFDDFMRTQV